MAFRDQSNQDSSTKKVLDYYQKYTQNSNLSKYFSGSGQDLTVDIPNKKTNQNTVKITTASDTLIKTQSCEKLSDDCENTDISDCNKNSLNINSHNNSPLQSPLDDKKLEWDSGADIGYYIAQSSTQSIQNKKSLRKCVSLPVLDNLKDVKLDINTLDLSSTPEQDDVKLFICSSTSDSTSGQQDLNENSKFASDVTNTYRTVILNSKTPSSSNISKTKSCQGSSSQSSCISEEEESKLLDFKMTLSYLKEKIGLPGAHSTPNIHENLDIEKITLTSKSLNKKDNSSDKSYEQIIPGGNFSIVSQDINNIKHNVMTQTKNQHLLPKTHLGIETENNNISKQVIKGVNKKVIELTISKPISIDWTSSEVIHKSELVDECITQDEIKCKAVQTDSICELKLGLNKKPPISVNKPIPLLSSEIESTNVGSNNIRQEDHLRTYSNCSSNCDSFEYIGNAADNNYPKQKEVLQPSKNKNNLSVICVSTASPTLNTDFKDPQYKDISPSPSSNSSSKSVSGDIKKHLDLLEKLLKSKKVHPNKKKYYIRKLIKDLSGFEDIHSNTSSGPLSPKNDEHKKDCSVPSELPSTQRSSLRKESSCQDLTKNKVYLKNCTDKQNTSDYLLQFAENERDYQINWIDHEISHLTKLKTILEVKSRGNINKRKINKTSVYKIMQNDGVSKNSERDYVIQTKFDDGSNNKIQYSLQGKKYSITDCSLPNTTSNSCKSSDENSVSADIRIHSEERQTNIKVSTSCRRCNQQSCVCESDIGKDGPKSNTDKKYSLSKLHTRETVAKICSDCEELECACQKSEPIRLLFEMKHRNRSNDSSSLTKKITKKSEQSQTSIEKKHGLSLETPDFLGYDIPEDFNSLQKIFKKCCCTVENRVCNCLFVTKLVNRLLPNNNKQFAKDVLSFPNEVKPKIILMDNKSRTSPLSCNNKEQFVNSEFETHGIQTKPNCNGCKLQLMHDLHFGIAKTTQTTDILKTTANKQIETEINTVSHGQNCCLINHEKYIYTNEKTCAEKTENSGHSLFGVNDNQNLNVKIKESIKIDDLCQKEIVKGKTMATDMNCTDREQKEIACKKSRTRIEDNNLQAASIANNKYVDIGIQASFDWLTKMKQTDEVNGVSDNVSITKPEDMNQNLSTKINIRHRDIGTQNDIVLPAELKYFNEHQKINTSSEGVKTKNSDTYITSRIDTGAQESMGFLMTMEHANKQQRQISSKEDVAKLGNRSMNFSEKIDTEYKNIGVQASVSFKNLSSQTSNPDFHNDRHRQREELSKDSNTKLLTRLELDTNSQSKASNRDFYKDGHHGRKKESSIDSSTKLRQLRSKRELDANRQSTTSNRNVNNDGHLEKKEDSSKYRNNNACEFGTKRELKTDRQINKNLDVEIDTDESYDKSNALGSRHSKEKMFTPPATHLTVSKAEASNDRTYADYSLTGNTSASISTSVFDSGSIPSVTCCQKKSAGTKGANVQHGNSLLPVCNRCVNRPVCNISNYQPRHNMCEIKSGQHCYLFCKCCRRKLDKSPVIPQEIAYNLIIQEPVTSKNKKQVTKGHLKDLNLVKAKDEKSEQNKENGYKNKSTGSSKKDKYKRNKRNYDESQPELIQKENQIQHTLEDYLIMNRPEFIFSAENRRQSILSSRMLREHQKNDLKLHFLENNLNRFSDKGPYKLFSEREMKAITKKNYQKLPEIQKRATNMREKRLRDADKLICHIFAKKIQRSALKGNWNFPIDKTLTNLK